jgi:hypothetical protein
MTRKDVRAPESTSGVGSSPSAYDFSRRCTHRQVTKASTATTSGTGGSPLPDRNTFAKSQWIG